MLISCFAILLCTSFGPDFADETKNRQLRILFISDLNAGYGDTTYSEDVRKTIARIGVLKPDIVLCGGDMVAGQKSTITAQRTHAMWKNFRKEVLAPIAAQRIPFGFTLGNHDASPNFAQDREIAYFFWQAEKQTTGLKFIDSAHYPFYFSYLKNNVLIISWDAAGAKVKPEVYNWLEKQLESPIAQKARFRVVLGHLPLYAIVASKNKPGEVNENPDSALAFFKRMKVDLYVSGHQHAYFPAHKNGFQLLNLGCIGDGPRPILGSYEPAKKAFTLLEIPVKDPKRFTERTWMPSNNGQFEMYGLPDSVVGFNGITKRRDVN